LASVGYDDVLRLWNMAEPYQLQATIRHPDRIQSVAFRPGSLEVATGCNDGLLRFWNAADATLNEVIPAHANYIRDLAYNVDGTLLASGGPATNAAGGYVIRLWDAAQKTWREDLVQCRTDVQSVAFNPQNTLLAWCEQKMHFGLYSLRDGTIEKPEVRQDGYPRYLTFDATGGLLAISFIKGNVVLWNVGARQVQARWRAHEGAIRALKFTADARSLIVGADDGTISLWEVATTQLWGKLQGHSGGVSTLDVSRDGSQLVSGSENGLLRIWNLEAAQGRAPNCARYLDRLRLDGREVTWNPLPVLDNLYDQDPGPPKSVSPDDLLSLLQTGLSHEQMDQKLFHRFLSAGNLHSASVIVDRHPDSSWRLEREQLGRSYLDAVKRIEKLEQPDENRLKELAKDGNRPGQGYLEKSRAYLGESQ